MSLGRLRMPKNRRQVGNRSAQKPSRSTTRGWPKKPSAMPTWNGRACTRHWQRWLGSKQKRRAWKMQRGPRQRFLKRRFLHSRRRFDGDRARRPASRRHLGPPRDLRWPRSWSACDERPMETLRQRQRQRLQRRRENGRRRRALELTMSWQLLNARWHRNDEDPDVSNDCGNGVGHGTRFVWQ